MRAIQTGTTGDSDSLATLHLIVEIAGKRVDSDPEPGNPDAWNALRQAVRLRMREKLGLDDLEVAVRWTALDLEVVLTSAKTAAKTETLMAGLRDLLDGVPELVRTQILTRVGGVVAVDREWLEIDRGLLDLKLSAQSSPAGEPVFSELAAYAFLTLLVLLVVVGAVLVALDSLRLP